MFEVKFLVLRTQLEASWATPRGQQGAIVVAVGASAAAGGLAIAGVNPVVWGGGTAAAATGGGAAAAAGTGGAAGVGTGGAGGLLGTSPAAIAARFGLTIAQIQARLHAFLTAGAVLARTPENTTALLAYRQIVFRALEKYVNTPSAIGKTEQLRRLTLIECQLRQWNIPF